jgi:hypothetical protein
LAPPPAGRGHRATLSLSVPSAAAASRARAGSIPWSPQTPQDSRPRKGPATGNGGGNLNGSTNNTNSGTGIGRGNAHSHKRSLSIVSMGTATVGTEQQNTTSSGKAQRPARGHARASSLQIVPRGGHSVNGPRSGQYRRSLHCLHSADRTASFIHTSSVHFAALTSLQLLLSTGPKRTPRTVFRGFDCSKYARNWSVSCFSKTFFWIRCARRIPVPYGSFFSVGF